MGTKTAELPKDEPTVSSAFFGMEDHMRSKGILIWVFLSLALINPLTTQGQSGDPYVDLVTKYYTDVLGREPEPSGRDWWVGEIQRVISD